jgi:amino acid adenylation domain-containing protein
MTDLSQRVASLSPAKLKMLLKHLEEKSGGGGGTRIERSPRRPGEPAPVSFPQRRLWFLDQLEPGRAAYNLPSALDLEGRLYPRALAQGLGEVARRHEALRTRFGERGGEPVQLIDPPSRPVLPWVDLTALAAPDRRRAQDRLAREDARRPFDLAQGPLVRNHLLRLGAERHGLLQNMHHVISDAWSRGVLLGEIVSLYQSFFTGRPSALEPLSIQYADYAQWQRERLSGARLDEQLAYWREALKDLPGPLDLPADRLPGSRADAAGGVVTGPLPEELVERAEALGRQTGATLFMTLFAAFAVQLARYSGQDDFLVGTPIANRQNRQLESLIGFFINTLVLRADLTGDPSFRGLLERIREMARGAYAHQDLPFETLVEAVRPDRGAGRQPLFSGMFVLENVPSGELRAPGLTFFPRDSDSGAAKFDWILSVEQSGDRYRLRLEFDRGRFEETTMRRWLVHFRTLLARLLEAPDRPVSAADPIPLAEAHQVRVEWNDTERSFPRDLPLGRLFERQVERAPQAPALVFGGETWTYEELDRRAELLARRLLSAGVEPEERVGVFLERSFELVAALVAVVKIGAVYVPLDLASPPSRLAQMLEDAQVRRVLTDRGLAARLPDGAAGLECLWVDELRATGEEPGPRPRRNVAAEQLAYVMFTSGSTGRPKGVAVPHRAVARLVLGSSFARLGPEQTVLQLAPVSFDASTLEIWGSLLTGGRLVIYPPGEVAVEEVARTAAEHGVTTLWLTAGLFHVAVDQQPEGLAAVEQVLAGGDVLSPAHARSLLASRRAAGRGGRLVNGYGPTENTTFTCCHTMTRPEDVGPGTVPIGRPIANTRVHVLDRDLRPVPMGVAGELVTGGDGLARGYAGRPAWTAERFIPDPLSQRPGAQLYRTGDRVRWLADGRLEFLGRMDQQVKVRGFRIEPAEVEAALVRHPRVRAAAVVVAQGNGAGSASLVAYLVPSPGEVPTVESLRRFLGSELPAYMVPNAYETRDALPLTEQGKVDRRALMASTGGALAAETPYVAPRNELEETLAGIWQELLPIDRVGIESNFFDLGGHSLLATQLVSQVRERLGVDLTLATFFEQPTVAGLAESLEVARWAAQVQTRDGDDARGEEREEGEL